MKNLSNGVSARKLEEIHFNNKLFKNQIVLETQKSLYNFFQVHEPMLWNGWFPWKLFIKLVLLNEN